MTREGGSDDAVTEANADRDVGVPLTRRTFVTRGALGLVSLPLLGGLASCATAMVHSAMPAPDGRLRLTLPDLPELKEPGGVAAVHVEGEEAPIFVVRTGEREYLALSSVCTHRGCTVEATSNGFACPCHGSRYGKTGDVVRGPAQRSLRRLTSSLAADGSLEVLLRGPTP